MGREISNRTLSSKKRKPYRFQSPETRRKCSEAGRRNIVAYRATVGNATHRTHGVCEALSTGNLPSEVARQVDEFESEILEELGRKPTARDRALILSSKLALSILILASKRLSNMRRIGRAKWLLATVVSFQNCLRLNLDALGGVRTTRKIEAAFPRPHDADERAEADKIVRAFIDEARQA